MTRPTTKEEWLPKKQFEIDGTEVIAWISSQKGFQDVTAHLHYIGPENKFHEAGWYWSASEELVKRPDLIHGVMPWPEPPVKFSEAA